MLICAATGNAGKLKEIRRILEAQGHTAKSQKELGITLEPEETGATFAENALIKARAICEGMRPAHPGRRLGPCGGGAGRRAGRLQRPLLRGARRRRGQQRQAAGGAGKSARRAAGRQICERRVLLSARRQAYHLSRRVPGPGGLCAPGRKRFWLRPAVCAPACGPCGRRARPNTEGRTYAELEAWEKDAISHRGAAMRLWTSAWPIFGRAGGA